MNQFEEEAQEIDSVEVMLEDLLAGDPEPADGISLLSEEEQKSSSSSSSYAPSDEEGDGTIKKDAEAERPTKVARIEQPKPFIAQATRRRTRAKKARPVFNDGFAARWNSMAFEMKK
jgi:hypothetical protein